MKRIPSRTRQEWMTIVTVATAATALAAAVGFTQTDTGPWAPTPRLCTLKVQHGASLPASRPSWDYVSQHSSSPKDICKAVNDHVRYSRDTLKEDEWRSGKDTWERGEGNCKDYASTVKDLCEEKGFNAEIYALQSKTARAGHAVTIGEKSGIMWLSSNGSYEEVRSLDDAKDKVARDLGWRTPDVDLYKVKESSTDSGPCYMDSDPGYVQTTTDTWR